MCVRDECLVISSKRPLVKASIIIIMAVVVNYCYYHYHCSCLRKLIHHKDCSLIFLLFSENCIVVEINYSLYNFLSLLSVIKIDDSAAILLQMRYVEPI